LVTGPAVLDPARLRRTLGDPALARLVDRMARRIVLGRPLTGSVTLHGASEEERRAVRGLLGPSRPQHGASLSVDLGSVAAALRRAGIADDLRSAVEALTGPVVPRAEARDAEDARRDAALAATLSCRHVGAAWFDAWVGWLDTEGVLTRLVRRDDDELIRSAAAVLDLLPVDGLPLPVVAERATGDTKALSGTPLSGLVLKALAFRAGKPVPRGREAAREIWETAGVILDDLSSHVLVLGLAASSDGPLGAWLTEAAELWAPFRITLHQLVTMPIVPCTPNIYVCENPSVVRAATARSAPEAALICTEGMPSVACQRLMAAIASAGLRIRWRGDFDWIGLRTTTMAIERYGASPWRMRVADYTTALAGSDSEPLRGAPADSPWDPPLAQVMAANGRAIMEERLIPELLADIR
jgi:uncharacterized protein (TIGR02679 family)